MDAFNQAVRSALKHLARRGLSRSQLVEKLLTEGFEGEVCDEAIARLEARGLFNASAPLFELTAKQRSAKAQGDLKLREQLDRLGFEGLALVELEGLPEEAERAKAVLASKRGAEANPAKAARFLASRGFTPETIEAVIEAMG